MSFIFNTMNSARTYIANEQNMTAGFTIVEVIVTIIVTSLFLIVFFQTILVLESQRVAVAQQAKASDVAYANLYMVTTRATLAGQACTSAIVSQGWDLANYGYTLNTPQGYTASLRAYPVSGCGDYENNPIRVVSTVKYKVNGTENTVGHAIYIR